MKRKIIQIAAALLLIAIIALPNFSSAQSIAAAWGHSLAICIDSSVRTWGANGDGQLGNGTNFDSHAPVQVSSLNSISAIAGGGQIHSLAVKNDGTVWAWGNNSHGQLGNGTHVASNVPVQVSSLTGVITIAGGYSGYSLALKNDGTVWSWGSNGNGQLGNGTNNDSTAPAQIAVLTGMIAISAGSNHALAVKNDGTVWAWGDNSKGQLGNGTTIGSKVPVQVSSLTGVIAISGGGFHSLALKNDGTIWAWGFNGGGQLGNGTFSDSNTPVLMSSPSGMVAIAGGAYHSVALKNDGTVWTCGNNDNDQLGNGTTGGFSFVLVQVTGLTGVIAIAAGSEYSLALKNDGTLWAWGINFAGQLGNGNTSSSNVPIQVAALCQVADITEITEPLYISVFPNPSTGYLTIDLGSNNKIIEVIINDGTGNIIYNITANKKQEIEVNTKDFEAGVYFVSIKSEDFIETKKLIVAK